MKIISGGQTGVDRAALDAAIACGVEHGGWCPEGRLSEDGAIPSGYLLSEVDSADHDIRTERNVMDSDATVIFSRDPALAGGTKLTRNLAVLHDKPVLVILENQDEENALEAVRTFVRSNEIGSLNVAGPRESEAPGLGLWVRRLVERLLRSSGDEVTPGKTRPGPGARM